MTKEVRFTFFLIALFLMACAVPSEESGPATAENASGTSIASEAPTALPTPTETVAPTTIPTETRAPTPTNTPTATLTPAPTATEMPSPTPLPTVDIASLQELKVEAGALYWIGDFDGSVALYSEALSLDPSDMESYALRADAYEGLGDYDAAIADYVDAVDLGSTDAVIFNNICWDYGITGRGELAIPFCEQAVALEPSASYLDSRGLAYGLIGEIEAAMADFEVVMDDLANSQDPEMREIRAERRVWLDLLRGGKNPFTPSVMARLRGEEIASMASSDQDVEILALNAFWQGRRFFNSNEYEEAIAAYSDAIELFPEFVEAYQFRGLAYRYIGQHELAIADYDQVVEYEPGDFDTQYLRGLTRGTLNDFEGAIVDYTSAIEGDPTVADYFAARGIAFSMIGEIATAEKDYNEALRLNPLDARYYFYRGMLHYMYTGESEKAIDDLKSALELGVPSDLRDTIQSILEELEQ